MRTGLKFIFLSIFTALLVNGYFHISFAQTATTPPLTTLPEAGEKGAPTPPVIDKETLEKLESWKSRLKTTLKAEQSVLRQLYIIESEMNRQQNELFKINKKLGRIRGRVAKYEAEIDRLKEDRDIRERRVKTTIRRLYKLGQGGIWQILLGSPNLKTFLIRYKALNVYFERDVKVITSFNERVRMLAGYKADLAGDIETLAMLKAAAEQRRSQVWVQREKRMVFLGEIERNKALALRATRELEQQDAALTTTIQNLPGAKGPNTVLPDSLVLDFNSRKGYLKLPVTGAIVSRFGRNTSRRFGTVTKNNGIDILVSQSTPVHVVADGRVRYTGDFLGYGQVVIVDHGGRYYSLYAHLDRFWVAKGDSIKARTAIGTVGKRGALAQSRLHFEIRHKGVALDPMGWIDFGISKED